MTVTKCCLHFAGALLAASSLVPSQAPSGFADLHAWYSPGRADNFATTDPSWQGSRGELRAPDYRFVRVEGHLFDPARPRPTGTVPLHGWYSPSRGDNFATTDPTWRGGPGQRRAPDYAFVRNEGYVFDPALSQPLGTVPLHSWYSPSRGDNFVTTDPNWRGGPGQRRSPDYVFVRVEGYVYEPGSLVRFAPGCGSGGGPILWSAQIAQAGQSFGVTMSSASQPIGLGLLLLDIQRTNPPIDLGVVGMPGCLLHVTPLVSLTFLPTRSPTELVCRFPMPNVPGHGLYMQGVVFERTPSAAGLVLTSAAVAVVQ